MNKPSGTATRRLVGLDGLRGLSLLAVTLVHVVIILPKPGYSTTLTMVLIGQVGRHGLTLFFVMSGFLIFLPFAAAAANRRALPNTRNYAMNRVLRIWPAYLVIFTIATVILPLGIVAQRAGCPGSIPVAGCNRQEIGRITDPLTLLANVTLFQGWFPSTAFTGLGVSWSLVTELLFYVIVPIMGLLAAALAKRFSPVVAVFLPGFFVLALGICFRWGTHAVWLHTGHTDDIPFAPTWLSVINRSFLGQADTFGLGMLLAAVMVWSRTMDADGHRRLRRGCWAVIIAAPVVTLIAYALGLRTGEFVTEVAAAAGAALMAVLLLPESGAVSRGLVSVLEIGVLRKLGDISLSWYMCHYAVILWFRAHAEWVLFDSFATMILAWVVVCIPISVLALLSHTFIETPAMNRKKMAS